MSDVPVGAFLSGGIDSSAVVAHDGPASTRSRSRPSRSASARTGFNELRYARRVAALIGTDHHELVLEPDVVPLVEDSRLVPRRTVRRHLGDSTYMVSKLAAEHVKVVLTGDGGDEIFAGYDKYVVEGRERAYDRVPASIRQATGAVGAAMPEGMRGPPIPPPSRAGQDPADTSTPQSLFHCRRDARSCFARTRLLK